MKQNGGPGPRPGFRGSEVERFWKRVVILDSGCWIWIGKFYRNGYGKFARETLPNGVYPGETTAHSWSYNQYVGAVPDGKEIHHTCENTACVNPLHMEPLTKREHCMKSSRWICAINASKTVCIRGHELKPLANGKGRFCPTCADIHGRIKYYTRRLEEINRRINFWTNKRDNYKTTK